MPELLTKLSRCKVQLLSKEPFPQPPIPGNQRLVPLCSAAEMRRETREMRNCLHKMIEEVFAGQVYFFSWKGAQWATVLVIYKGSELAHLEVKGKANAAVLAETISEIRVLVRNSFRSATWRENIRMPVPWPNRLFNLCLEYYYTIEFAVLRNPHPNLTLCYENRRPQTAFGEKEGAFSCWRGGPQAHASLPYKKGRGHRKCPFSFFQPTVRIFRQSLVRERASVSISHHLFSL